MTAAKTTPKPRKSTAKPTFDPEALREMASRLLTLANEAEAGR